MGLKTGAGTDFGIFNREEKTKDQSKDIMLWANLQTFKRICVGTFAVRILM